MFMGLVLGSAKPKLEQAIYYSLFSTLLWIARAFVMCPPSFKGVGLLRNTADDRPLVYEDAEKRTP